MKPSSSSSIFSLDNPPPAPKKTEPQRNSYDKLTKVRRMLFSLPSPPPAPKKKRTTKVYNLTPIALEWEEEAKLLASTREVRAKYLTHSPQDVAEESNKEYLERLWELYFPCSQPRNAYEESYLSLMRSCIDSRLAEL